MFVVYDDTYILPMRLVIRKNVVLYVVANCYVITYKVANMDLLMVICIDVLNVVTGDIRNYFNFHNVNIGVDEVIVDILSYVSTKDVYCFVLL